MKQRMFSVLLIGLLIFGQVECRQINNGARAAQNKIAVEAISDQGMTNAHMPKPLMPLNRYAITKSFENKKMADVFSTIYKTNYWCGPKSRSGNGSSLVTTKIVRDELSNLCKSLGIKTVLDIGCGDFYWMRTVDLHGAEYIGVDIVPEMIKKNCEIYADAKHTFLCLNSAEDSLPKADLVICRDVLMHLNFSTVYNVLQKIKESGSKYALMTTHLSTTRNENIVCGRHCPYKLTIAPFNLPEPIVLIEELCAEEFARKQRKALGLWLVDDIDLSCFEK